MYWLRKNGRIACSRPSPLNGKTPQELCVMAETRKLLLLLLTQTEETSPELRAAIETALRHRARRSAPFLPLNDEQRLAWLDEVSHILCRLDLPGHFQSGQAYRVECHDIPIRQLTTRKRVIGNGQEEVLITGAELLITLRDDDRRLHAFCHSELPADPRLHAIHPLPVLVEHFTIPAAHDITKVFPATYQKHKTTLEAL